MDLQSSIYKHETAKHGMEKYGTDKRERGLSGPTEKHGNGNF